MNPNTTLKLTIAPIPAENLQNANIGLKMFLDNVVPFLRNLSPEEKRSMMKIGSRNVDFVSKDLSYATASPQFQPTYFDLGSFSTSLEAFGQFRTLQQPILQVADMLEDSIVIAGNGAMIPALAYYQSVKTAARMNLPGAATIADDLGARFAGQGPRTVKTTAVKA